MTIQTRLRFSTSVLFSALIIYRILLSAGAVNAESLKVPKWQDSNLKAIARVVSQRCIGPCNELNQDQLARVGTGFLAELKGFRNPVLVTALHVVAGANRISYEFTEIGAQETSTQVIAIDKDADLAILYVDQNHSYHIRPLKIGKGVSETRDVIVYGHKQGALSILSDEGRIKLKSPKRLSGMPLGKEGFAQIRKLGYPDMDLSIVGLEQALNPGDSGAPVFDPHGTVVGMAHGGIPTSSGEIAWMVPSSRITNLTQHRTSAGELPRFNLQHVFSAVNTFYSSGNRQRTPFGTRPSLAFAVQWPAVFSPMKEYSARLDKRSEKSINWLQDRSKIGRYRGRQIGHNEPYFPAASTEPYDCNWEDEKLCKETTRRENELLKIFDAMTIEVVCYRAEVFENILSESKPKYYQADLRLEIPIGKFSKAISDGKLGMEFDWNGTNPGTISIYTESFIEYRHGSDSAYKRHPDIEHLEDLYGGACRFGLASSNYSMDKQIASLENYLRFGGACVHLILAPETHTPISFTSFLPRGNDLNLGGIWGVLPLSHVTGTIDDMACH